MASHSVCVGALSNATFELDVVPRSRGEDEGADLSARRGPPPSSSPHGADAGRTEGHGKNGVNRLL